MGVLAKRLTEKGNGFQFIFIIELLIFFNIIAFSMCLSIVDVFCFMCYVCYW